jgi:uncharacterized protein (DUF433 family)
MTALKYLPESTRRDLGQGFYSLGDLRLYVAYSGVPSDADHVLNWLTAVLNPVPRQPRNPDHSFSDLVSLFVVRELLRKGVRPWRITSAERYLREKWRTDRPFVSDEIQTDGCNVFVDEEPVSGQIEAADLHGQQAMLELVKDRLTHVHYNDGAAAYWTPREFVLVDPRVQFGEPVVEGTRVPTGVVADVALNMGPDGAAQQLGVSSKAARAAISFEKRLAALRE